MTNREWIAGMTDKQLAEFLYAIQDYPSCEYCSYDSKRSCAINQDCLGGMEKWLKQEHKENSND